MKTLRFLCLTGCLLTPMLLGNVAMAAPKTAATQSNDENDLWAEVQKGGAAEDYQAYLDAYPTGKYAPLAKSRLKKRTGQPTPVKRGKASRLPPRPELPFAVSEDVWQSLEASDDYRLWPKLKATIRVNARYTVRNLDAQGKELMTLKSNDETEITPLGEKCLTLTLISSGSTDTVNMSNASSNIKTKSKRFACAGNHIGGILNMLNGKEVTNSRLHTQNTSSSYTDVLSRLETQAGLYPLKMGEEHWVRTTTTLDGGPMFREKKCRITDQKPASELHPLFTGAAWTVQCEGKWSASGNSNAFNNTEIFIADLGIDLSLMLSPPTGGFMADHLPKLGEPIVQTFPGGAKRIVTYEQYDVSIDRE